MDFWFILICDYLTFSHLMSVLKFCKALQMNFKQTQPCQWNSPLKYIKLLSHQKSHTNKKIIIIPFLRVCIHQRRLLPLYNYFFYCHLLLHLPRSLTTHTTLPVISSSKWSKLMVVFLLIIFSTIYYKHTHTHLTMPAPHLVTLLTTEWWFDRLWGYLHSTINWHVLSASSVEG